MKIIKVTSTINTTHKSNRTIKYIVIHYTASTKSAEGSAKRIASMFKDASRGASADYIVDDKDIVQYNPDIKNRYTWAVGGSKYGKCATKEGATHYGKCTNANSISIEMVSSKKNTKSLKATDKDWYITEATEANAIELVKYLMDKYNIPIDNVIMHHNVTGKICPNPYCVNDKALINWKAFKLNLQVPYKVETTVKNVKLYDKLGGTVAKKYDKGAKLNVGKVVVYKNKLYAQGLKTKKYFRLKNTKVVNK